MKPFVRPRDRSITPQGWVAEPAGVWAGRPDMEIVYDPRCHELVRLQYGGDRERAVLGTAGYRRVARDEHQELWARDRIALAQRRLDRSSAHRERDAGLTVGA